MRTLGPPLGEMLDTEVGWNGGFRGWGGDTHVWERFAGYERGCCMVSKACF